MGIHPFRLRLAVRRDGWPCPFQLPLGTQNEVRRVLRGSVSQEHAQVQSHATERAQKQASSLEEGCRVLAEKEKECRSQMLQAQQACSSLQQSLDQQTEEHTIQMNALQTSFNEAWEIKARQEKVHSPSCSAH